MSKKDLSTITGRVRIDADGDVYIWGKNKKYNYIGCLYELDTVVVPNPCYKRAKRLTK
jgi:hypothetical protein